jgi:hypothetical protein
VPLASEPEAGCPWLETRTEPTEIEAGFETLSAMSSSFAEGNREDILRSLWLLETDLDELVLSESCLPRDSSRPSAGGDLMSDELLPNPRENNAIEDFRVSRRTTGAFIV